MNDNNKSLRKLMEAVNVPKKICNHFLGQHHTKKHRMFVGGGVMITGVLVARLFQEVVILHIIFDMFGYLIHGIGTIPFAEALLDSVNKEDCPDEQPDCK